MTTAIQSTATPAPDYATIKQRQQATWAAGDYAVIGTTLQIVGENLCEAIDLCAGETVLDVAAGNGNACLAAARRYAEVIATDYVPKLLEQAKNRAEAEGLSIIFETADAEDLPYENGSFDVALSTFGVMFTPNQAKAASEMARVVRKGGRIGMANWTPESYIGQLFKIIGSHVPPPAGVQPPSLWGTEARLKELFAGHKVSMTKRMFNFRYKSPEHWLDVFRTYYGPTNRAFAALNEPGQKALRADIMALLERLNVAGKRALVVPSEYLEVVVVKA
jgi:ubiquinone/menaquinone biosynthesis C-methylase UbiE